MPVPLHLSIDTTVVGLITDNDKTAYREEVRDLEVWCQDKNLSLIVSKTNELIVDYRKRRAEQAPINIDGDVVEQVEIFMFLCIHITKKLSRSKHTKIVGKRARQNLFPLRRLKRLSGSQILKRFYSCTIESILTGCITTWYGNCSASDRKALQRVVRTAQYITGAKLPAIQNLYHRRFQKKAHKIVRLQSPKLDCFLCYYTASGTRAPSLVPKGSSTASTSKPLDC